MVFTEFLASKGFYSRNKIPLTPKVVHDTHKRGGTILGTSHGGHGTLKIVDSIQDRGINQVYIIGGDGTQNGPSFIFEEIRRRGLKVSVVGIPKTIDNDFLTNRLGFDTTVEEAQRAINATHVEAESVENGIGFVKLMGRYSGPGGLFEFIGKRLKENGHMVLVVAQGAGQEFLNESKHGIHHQDASGNKQLQDIGLWISQKIKDHFSQQQNMTIDLKYIDPTYMTRAVTGNASDNVYCTLLAHSAVHGAMAGYTGLTVGPVNARHAYIPFNRVLNDQKPPVEDINDGDWQFTPLLNGN